MGRHLRQDYRPALTPAALLGPLVRGRRGRARRRGGPHGTGRRPGEPGAVVPDGRTRGHRGVVRSGGHRRRARTGRGAGLRAAGGDRRRRADRGGARRRGRGGRLDPGRRRLGGQSRSRPTGGFRHRHGRRGEPLLPRDRRGHGAARGRRGWRLAGAGGPGDGRRPPGPARGARPRRLRRRHARHGRLRRVRVGEGRDGRVRRGARRGVTAHADGRRATSPPFRRRPARSGWFPSTACCRCGSRPGRRGRWCWLRSTTPRRCATAGCPPRRPPRTRTGPRRWSGWPPRSPDRRRTGPLAQAGLRRPGRRARRPAPTGCRP